MTTIHFIAAAFVAALLLAPAVVITLLTRYALNQSLPFDLLSQSSIPQEHKDAAYHCFQQTKQLCAEVTKFDATAPYVALLVTPFAYKWDKLPDFLRPWDNERGLHGDKFPWIKVRNPDGSWPAGGVKQPIPLGNTCLIWSDEKQDNVEVEAKSLNYWQDFKRHPRTFIATFEWIGLRNRASMASYDRGVEITPELKQDSEYWGDLNVGETVDGKLVEGVLIRRAGPYYEIYAVHIINGKIRRVRFGYKIGNAMGSDPEHTRAMVVGIGISFKRLKNST